MTNAEKAKRIEEAIKLLASAASAYRHGGGPTAADKFDVALDVLELIACD
jgi:hypothetical protein